MRAIGFGGVVLLLGTGTMSTHAQTPAAIALDTERRAALAALPPLRGSGFAAKELLGKPVLVSFFASWCPPCHVEFDHLARLHAAYHDDGLEVIAINIFERFFAEGAAQRLDRFLAAKAPAFHVLGEGESIAPLFGDVDRIPTVFLFDGEGKAIYSFVHERGAKKTHSSYEELDAALRRTK